MRVLVALAVVVVFGALWFLDTAGLVRLTIYCATGGCGVPPLWIALGAGGLVLAAVASSREARAGAKPARGAKNASPRSPRKKAGTDAKPKPANGRPRTRTKAARTDAAPPEVPAKPARGRG